MANIAKIAESKTETASLRQHLRDVVRGPAFHGSHRSGQFLEYIVEKALAGQFDSLKERVIGMELFSRIPSYDTGEDSIVRVTASDVRRRLLQHYGTVGVSSKLRISLPTGSYVPEITYEQDEGTSEPDAIQVLKGPPQLSRSESADPAQPSQEPATLLQSDLDQSPAHSKFRSFRLWLALGFLLVIVNLLFWGIYLSRSSQRNDAAISVTPWSTFFSSPHPLHLITSDPNIYQVEQLTGTQISLPDYAIHAYIPEPNKMDPASRKLSDSLLRGDKSASAVDPPIVAEIAALAQKSSRKIDVRAARNIQFSDLKNDDNFIFLGSPSSDPWSNLFSEQLDFRFVFDNNSGQEIIRNMHPRQGEPPAYLPTAPGWATGKSYAIIAFIHNPDQAGRVLLIAGMNGEGTEAAGKLVTDLPRFNAVLQRCGIAHLNPPQEFEVLLQLDALAGSPHQVDVPACHLLSAPPIH